MFSSVMNQVEAQANPDAAAIVSPESVILHCDRYFMLLQSRRIINVNFSRKKNCHDEKWTLD